MIGGWRFGVWVVVATVIAVGAGHAAEHAASGAAARKKIDPLLLEPVSVKKFAVKGGVLAIETRKRISGSDKRKQIIVGCTSVAAVAEKVATLKTSRVTGMYPEFGCLTVALGSEADLETIASLPEVVHIRPAFRGEPNVGVATNQGDEAHGAKLVRDGRYLDGFSQKVGILSDSFAYGPPVRGAVTTPAQNEPGILRGATPQLTGDLPSEVELLADDAATFWSSWTPSDEGEAMAELIYDIAPGAALAFHTAEPDFLRMAQGISALVAAGCSVITDDYTYFDEPWFMEGPVSSAIGSAVRSGVAYFTCAGNSADSGLRLIYRDSDPSQTDEAYPASGADLVDWGGGFGPYLPITFNPPESEAILVLQWNQPWATFAPRTGGSQIDLDLYFMPTPAPPSAQPWFFDSSAEQGTTGAPGGDPIEVLAVHFTGSVPFTAYVAVDHCRGRRDRIPQNPRVPVELWLWVYRALEYGIDVPTVGPVTTGHQTAPGVGCVGAVYYGEVWDPTMGPTMLVDPEWFSARGGNIQIPFDRTGRYRPRVATVPNLAGVDGCDTLFFGGSDDDGSGFPDFFGTSASAPNVAAVAALLRQADTKLKPADVLRALSRTAWDVTGARAAAGFDAVTGAGVVNAVGAVSTIRKGENLAPIPFATAEGVPIPTVTKDMTFPGWDRLVLRQSPTFVGMDQVPLAPGEPIYAWFSVANTGTSEAGTGSFVDLTVRQGGTVVWSQRMSVPPLYGPSRFDFEAVSVPPLEAGIYEFEIRVDPTGRIRELNEKDNVYREEVLVSE